MQLHWRGRLILCVRCAICDRCAIGKTLRQMRHLEENSLSEKASVQEPASAAGHEKPSLCTASHLASELSVALAAPREKTCVRRAVWESTVSESPLACAVWSDRHARSLRRMRHSRALDKGRHLRQMRHLCQMRQMQGDATVARGIIASYRSSETCRMMCEEKDHFHPSASRAHQLPRLDPSHPPRQPDHALPDCRHQWIDAAFSEPGWCRSSHCSISCGVRFHS